MIAGVAFIIAAALLAVLTPRALRWVKGWNTWRLELITSYRDTLRIDAVRRSNSLPIVEVTVTHKTPEQLAEIVAEALSEGETKIAILNGAQRDVNRTRP